MFKHDHSICSHSSSCDSWQLAQIIGIVSLILMLVPLSGFAEEYVSEIEVPWEPEDLPVGDYTRFRPPPSALLKSLARPAIHFYRRHISSQSTDRCPFHISCSHFAEKAVERFGFVQGVALFIDRHFFREHVGARQYYALRETLVNNRITLKLDDSFYLADKRGEIAE